MDWMLEPPEDEPVFEDLGLEEEWGEEWERWLEEQKLEYPHLSDDEFMALDAWVEKKYQDLLEERSLDGECRQQEYNEYYEEECS